MRINHNLDSVLDQIGARLTAAERQAIPRAMPRALNRVSTLTRTQAVRLVAVRMGVSHRRTVRQAIRLIRANRSSWKAGLHFFGPPLGLRHFKARKAPKGVVAQAWGERHLYRGAFMVSSGGAALPFKRGSGGRRRGPAPHYPGLPIAKLWGPSVAWGASNPEVLRQLRRVVRDRLPVELKRQLAFAGR